MTVRWQQCHEHGMHEASEMIKLLLSYGADPSLSDVDDPDTTPLSLAAELGMNGLVCFLIKSGANVRQRSVLGKICRHCDLDVLRFALDMGGNINVVDSEGSTLLYHAAKNKDVDVMKYLLRSGLANQVNTPNRKGKMPLLKAIRADQSDHVVVLAEHGADVNIVHPMSLLPALHIACRRCMSFAAVSALIDAGADVNREAGFSSVPPLHAAAGKAETLRAVLQSGKPFDIAARDRVLGNTALHDAIDRPWRPKAWTRDIVRILLAAGAPDRAENDFGCTPIDMAFVLKEFEYVYWMLTGDLEFCEDDSIFNHDEKAKWLADHQMEYEELRVLGLINLELCSELV